MRGRSSVQNPTRVGCSHPLPLCPLLCEYYFFAIGADCEELLFPSQHHLLPLPRDPHFRQSLVVEHCGGPPMLDKTPACAQPCPHPLRMLVTSLPIFCRDSPNTPCPANTCVIRKDNGSPSRFVQTSQFGRTDLTARWL